MKHKKRTFLIISALYFASSILLHVELFKFSSNLLFVLFVIVALVVTVALLLIRLFEYKNIINKLVFFELFMVGNLLFLFEFPTLSNVSKLVYILFTSIFTYIVLLSINVFFVSERHEEKIPLLQPAKLFSFIAIILSVFTWSTIFYKLSYIEYFKNLDNQMVPFIITTVLFVLYYYLLIKNLSWFLIDDKVGEISNETIERSKSLMHFIIMILSQISIILMFTALESFARSLILSSSVYVVFNIVDKYMIHKVNNSLYVKSFFIIFITYLLVILL